MPESELREGVTRLVLAVFRAHQALVVEGDRRVAKLGLNSARWKVLGAIELAGEPLTAPEIGRRMGLTRQGAQKQLDALTAEGMVQRRDNPAHLRAPLYALTAAGRRGYARASAVWAEWAVVLGGGVPVKNWHAAAEAVETLIERLEMEKGAQS
jgi:DNA-binding MarR family transcriptional regulator